MNIFLFILIATVSFISIWAIKGHPYLVNLLCERYTKTDPYNAYHRSESKISVLSFILCLAFPIVITAVLFGGYVDVNQQDEHLYYIESLNDHDDVTGNFVLGIGGVKSKDWYTFYVKTDRGYNRKKALVSDSYIIDRDWETM